MQLGFVIAEERVGDLLVGQQIQVNVAGDSGRQPAALLLLYNSGNLPELPTGIERENRVLHRLGLRARHSASDTDCRRYQGAANYSPANNSPHCTPSKAFHTAAFTTVKSNSQNR